MSEITINKLELASILADRELREQFKSSFQIDTVGVDGVEGYTEDAQDEFNRLYDKYLTLIESCES